MDSKLDSNKDEKSHVTENDASKAKTSRIKLFVGVIAVAVAITAAIASALVNRPQRDDVVILTPPADSSQADKVDNSGSEKVISKTAKAHTTKKTVTSKAVTSSIAETKEEYRFPADINKADKEMLMAVSGIGDRIIAYRDRVGVISNMDMLLEVNGIGDSTLELLKGYFYVDSADYHDMPQETKVAETQPVQTEIPADTVTEPPATEEQTVTTAETTEKVRQKVNINKADAQEISDKLLIDMDKANAVIELRELISYYESPNELLLCKGFTEKLVSELWDYIEI
jgi:competence protein ComEA